MPLPIPLLLLAGALLFGGKKKKKKPSATRMELIPAQARPPVRPIHATKATPTTKETGKSWARCKPPAGSPEGTYAAFGQGGRCMVFWTPETSKAVKERLVEEYDKAKNKNEICAPDKFVEDKYGFGVWKVNKARENLVKNVIREFWPQISQKELPPIEGRSTYFVSMIWNLCYGWFTSQVCNIGRVT